MNSWIWKILNCCLGYRWILICESISLTQCHFGMANFFVRGIFIWLVEFLNGRFLEHGIFVDIMMINKFWDWLYFSREVFFVYCRILRAEVVFSCWNKVGTWCRQTLEMLSMTPVSRPFSKLFGIMIPLNIKIFNYSWHCLNGSGIRLVLSTFRVLVKWC